MELILPIVFISVGLFLVSAWLGGRTEVAEWLIKNMRHGYVWNETKKRSGIRRVLMWFGIMGIVFIIVGCVILAEILR